MSKNEKIKVINQWLTDNYNQLEINVWKVCGHSQAAHDKWGNDIIPYVWEGFRKMDLDKQYEIITQGKPEFYLTRAMALSIKSNTSPFYNIYRKFSRISNEFNLGYHDKEDEVSRNKKELNESELSLAVKGLDYYDHYLITEYYFNNKKAREIAEVTGISSSTVSSDIKRALKRLKTSLNGKVEF